jgi:hypothetical protein
VDVAIGSVRFASLVVHPHDGGTTPAPRLYALPDSKFATEALAVAGMTGVASGEISFQIRWYGLAGVFCGNSPRVASNCIVHALVVCMRVFMVSQLAITSFPFLQIRRLTETVFTIIITLTAGSVPLLSTQQTWTTEDLQTSTSLDKLQQVHSHVRSYSPLNSFGALARRNGPVSLPKVSFRPTKVVLPFDI